METGHPLRIPVAARAAGASRLAPWLRPGLPVFNDVGAFGSVLVCFSSATKAYSLRKGYVAFVRPYMGTSVPIPLPIDPLRGTTQGRDQWGPVVYQDEGARDTTATRCSGARPQVSRESLRRSSVTGLKVQRRIERPIRDRYRLTDQNNTNWHNVGRFGLVAVLFDSNVNAVTEQSAAMTVERWARQDRAQVVPILPRLINQLVACWEAFDNVRVDHCGV